MSSCGNCVGYYCMGLNPICFFFCFCYFTCELGEIKHSLHYLPKVSAHIAGIWRLVPFPHSIYPVNIVHTISGKGVGGKDTTNN